jgi:SAM-dependent methyltransferase
MTIERRSKLLEGLDLTHGKGLEIGALNRPLLRRPQNNVTYLDHADTLSLRGTYAGDPNVPPDDLVDVDIVWEGQKLESVAAGRRFDYAVASHVFEHVPDIVWWLSELCSVLVPFGQIRLAIPDKRFCFDFVRRETTIADVLAAWVSEKRRPDPRDILDFWGHYRAVDSQAAWRGEYPADTAFHTHEVAAALQRCRDAIAHETYHDVHCTVCTPQSFADVMCQLAALRLLPFGCTQIYGTAPGDCEFFVHLLKMDDVDAIEKSWHWAKWVVTQP